LKIQIYGAGMSGSFLYMLLRDHHEVRSIDVRVRPPCECAWEIPYDGAKRLYSLIGVDFEDYVLSRPKHIVINGIAFRNMRLVLFDRRRLLRDLWRELEFGELKPDLSVDATGTERAFLPRIKNDEIYFTLQSLEKHRIEEDIFIYVRRTGYAWAFPLGDNLWHVGVGEKSMQEAIKLLRLLRGKYGFEEKRSLCRCRSHVRLMPPSRCMPILHGSVVGVGEAIGCISGFGEGNLPALQSAKILYECIMSDRLGDYEREILRKFKWIEEEHELVRWAQSKRKTGRLRMALRAISVFARRALFPTPKTFRDAIHQLRLGMPETEM